MTAPDFWFNACKFVSILWIVYSCGSLDKKFKILRCLGLVSSLMLSGIHAINFLFYSQNNCWIQFRQTLIFCEIITGYSTCQKTSCLSRPHAENLTDDQINLWDPHIKCFVVDFCLVVFCILYMFFLWKFFRQSTLIFFVNFYVSVMMQPVAQQFIDR